MGKIDEVKVLLDAINSEDVAEDAEFQKSINNLSAKVASITAERDALKTERDTTIAFLVAQRASIDARLTALGG